MTANAGRIIEERDALTAEVVSLRERLQAAEAERDMFIEEVAAGDTAAMREAYRDAVNAHLRARVVELETALGSTAAALAWACGALAGYGVEPDHLASSLAAARRVLDGTGDTQ